ncbi:hypothetical protein BGZ91_008937, partial [Linnemannia elongata]
SLVSNVFRQHWVSCISVTWSETFWEPPLQRRLCMPRVANILAPLSLQVYRLLLRPSLCWSFASVSTRKSWLLL